MNSKSQTGQLGEDIAAEYLVDKGYKIIGRNCREKWGELDIVAKAPDKTLVFVEVKTLRRGSGQEALQPEDNLTQAKLAKLKRAAGLYANSSPDLINENRGWRIDLVAVSLRTLTPRYNSGQDPSTSSGQANTQKDCEIKHYENL